MMGYIIYYVYNQFIFFIEEDGDMEWTQTIVIIASFLGANSIFYILIRGEMNNRFSDMNKRFDTLEKSIGEIREDIRLIFNKIIPNRKK